MEPFTTAFASVALVAFGIGGAAAFRRYRTKLKSLSRRQQHRTERIDHVLRLASEIAVVARTIESDLAPFRSVPALARLQARSRRLRLRVEAACSRDRLADLPWFELEAHVSSIHDDHLKMVALRALADTEISGWRKHVRRGVDTTRSSWPFMSTPLTSGFEA